MNVAGWKDVFEAIKHKDVNAVKWFIEEKGVPVSTCNEEGQTIAHIAVETDQYTLVRYCVDKDPSVITIKDEMMRNILIRAVQKNMYSTVAYLLENHHQNILEAHNLFFGLTIVHLAAQHGYLELLKYFIEERNIDCEIKNDAQETPLFFAVENVHMPVIKYLVEEQQVNVLEPDENNDHVLYVSAWRGDLTVPKYLLDECKKEIDLNYKDKFGETVLHRGVKFNHLDFTKYLVEEKQVQLDLIDNEGMTPLHHAAVEGHPSLVKYLCEKGARTDIRNAINQTATESAKDQRIKEYLKMVVSKRPRRSKRFATFEHRTITPSMLTGAIRISNSVPSIGDGPVLPENELLTSFNNILIFTSNYLSFSTILGYLQAHAATPLSPPEVLRNRMDNIAVEAIESDSNFENP